MTLKDLLFVIAQVFLFLVFIAFPGGFAAPFGIQLLAFVMVTGGALLTATSMMRLGSGLTPSPRPDEKSKLITSGVYKYIRHPIYSGIILILTGISVYSLNFPRGLLTLLLLILFYYKSRYEEELLLLRYPEYRDYMKHTGRFFPVIRIKN